MARRPSLTTRLGRFFGVDDPWERNGRVSRGDLFFGFAVLAFSAITLELVRSLGVLEDASVPEWGQWFAIVIAAILMVGRRRWPLTVASLAAMHMFVTGVLMPEVMGQVTMQVVYFVAFFSGVAWGRSRRDVVAVMSMLVVFMSAWLCWEFALGNGMDRIRDDLGSDADDDFGLIAPTSAAVLLTAVINVLYFAGAIALGQIAWRNARQRDRLATQTRLLQSQTAELRRRAVIEERMRIARELHDVVAHHVSVIGINAGAARRVLRKDGPAAEQALGQIEQSSRQAVSQMRGLLGTLRALETGRDSDADPDAESRAPEPGLNDLPALVADGGEPDLVVTYELVTTGLRAEQVPPAVGLSLYRITQESLANVRRHSTARAARVVVRLGRHDGFDERASDGAGND
ncbi:MAG: sensor histidine kinase, partial [Nocardioides sp.]